MDRRRFSPDEEVAPRAWAGLAVVAAALFVATLDAMVLYVAFGTIRRDFPDVSAAALSWILSGYTIVLAAGMIGAGRWADRLGRRRLDESREPDGSRLPDPVGTVVVTVALVLLALAIVQSGAWGWSSTRTVGALLVAVVLLGAFAGRCATVPNSVLPLDLFSERGFRWANLGQLLYGTGFTIMFFGNVQFLREVWGYSPVWTGLAMAPGPLVVFLLAPWLGRLAGRIGQRPILIPGGGISAAAALFLLSRVDSAPAYLAVWLPFTLVSGVGVSM